MKKFFAVLLAVILTISSVVCVNAAMGYHSGDGFTYEADTKGNLSVAGYDGDDMVIADEYLLMPIVKVKSLAFKDNTTIKSVSFDSASNLTNIGTYAFSGCTGLTSVNIPSTVTGVGTAAFKGCSSIESVYFYTTKLPNECFRNCTALETVVLNSEIESIGNYAFGGCSSLRFLELPKSVNSISTTAFKDTSVTLGVYFDSYAYHYAKDNDMEYELIDCVKLGDANNDDNVDVNDATFIQSYLAELATLEGIYLHAADTNEDGEVDVSDATAIQMYAAEYQTGHPIGQVLTK